MAKKCTISVGDKVRYSPAFLRSTGQYTGDIPHARGTVVALKLFGNVTLATIDWANPEIPAKVLTSNLEKAGK
jgi:hypothetical protein